MVQKFIRGRKGWGIIAGYSRYEIQEMQKVNEGERKANSGSDG